MMRFAEIAVDAPAGYDRTFSYSIPPDLHVGPGHLVRVPFGRRTLQGVVFALADAPQVPETRDVLEASFPEPVLTETHLALARWISRYYMCSLFEAAALMLPPGGRIRPKTYLTLADENGTSDAPPLTPLQARVLEYIRKRGAVQQERLTKIYGERFRTPVNRLVDKGYLVRETSAARPSVGPKFQEVAMLMSHAKQEVEDWLPIARKKAPRQAALIEHLTIESPLETSTIRKEYGASALKSLVSKEWIELETVRVDRDPLAGFAFGRSAPVTMTPRQQLIAIAVRAAIDDLTHFPRAFLVQGVTGSGKTEIYMDAVERCLASGRKAIVLVPEIALTHQTIERFASRFPGQVAVQHSRLSAGERHDQWWKIKRGEYGIVIGSRSAVFAPQPDLGLIVLDEEHEWTYKQQEPSPRYHAYGVASQLSELTGAVVLSGSASPDVGSYYKGLRKDTGLFLLPDRIASGRDGANSTARTSPLAKVDLVDMRRELREGNRDMFSRNLMTAMGKCLDSRGQMILFLNRRGASSYMQCRRCGYGVRCRRCDIAMTLHKEPDRLLCHYCGDRRPVPDQCPECLTYRMSFYGIGTEAVASEVALLFPDAGIIRWDRDTARGPKAYETMLKQFRSGEAQVLVGTQMIAKGLHFPEVTLVGVVSADVGLHVPDYRAGERTFQLLCQVAGRAGRGERAGRVIIQTYQPENYAVQAAATQDYQAFYRKEMAFRRQQGNPPYSKLARLLFSHPNQAHCEQEAGNLARAIREQRDAWGFSDIDLLGPVPAYPSRIRGHYRWHIVLRGPEPRKLLDQISIPTGWIVDVDPVSMT